MIRYPFENIPPEGEAVEVADGVLWMRLPLPMALDHVNVYALDDGDGWTIIDSGFASRGTKAIWRKILDGPLQGRPIRRILVTHHHPDHVGLAGWFQTAHGAELVTTRTAWLFSRMLLLDEQDRPTEEQLTFWRRAGMDPDILNQRANERPFNYADCVDPMPLGFRRVQEGQTIRAGQRNWTVRLGNGHAPDHVTLWSQDDNLVIAGDQLLPSISSNLGVYATEPEADPVAQWLDSCESFKPHVREDQLVLPGHKLPYTGLPTRLRQLIENHHGALDRLRQHLREPGTAGDCFLPLFKRKISAGEYGLALVEAVAHVNHLHQAGELTRTLREDGAWLWQLKEPQDG
ncbi:MBL fold metallo-hydrolase [Actibacterium pelagium]|uniref:MBL fold hydrolase n=1 Tax=Actibacterium pelagium TaxID=2029103 RepID=A0A917ELX4_9RHOB|nr:MBL fold metallo-hydrolase [Actibacterium pelagium]GGE53992.1 MBL fold hydrolase [Actibacterium pelagium]